MKPIRFAIVAALAMALTTTASFADDHDHGNNSAPAISRVEAPTFQLHQTDTKKLNDSTSRSTYKGDTILTITPCGPGATPYTLAVEVELRTQTTENACGDGYTNGQISLIDPVAKQSIVGDVAAVNRNFGELSGLIQGRLAGHSKIPLALRASFTATFVKDTDGNYTLVNVDAHGVLVSSDSHLQDK